MKIISNISNITDNSGTIPVVTYSNQVQTLIQTPSIPNHNCARICGVILCNNPCCNPFNNCNNMCHHNNNCGSNNANANFATGCACNCHNCSCCHHNNCCNNCNNCNCFNAMQANNFCSQNNCQNFGNSCEEIVYHYYCNQCNN